MCEQQRGEVIRPGCQSKFQLNQGIAGFLGFLIMPLSHIYTNAHIAIVNLSQTFLCFHSQHVFAAILAGH